MTCIAQRSTDRKSEAPKVRDFRASIFASIP